MRPDMKLRSPLLLLALLCTGYALSFFHRVCPAVLAPELMEAFKLDATSFSLISSATMLGYAVTQIPSGLLADIMGGRRTMALYQVLAGSFCIAFTFCGSMAPAVFCRFLLGLTLACNVPAYKILAASVPADRYAQYCSILTGCSAVGTLLAASPLVAITNLVGWQIALLLAGIFTVLIGVAVFLLLEDSDCANSRDVPSPLENLRALKKGLYEVVHLKNFWLIFLWFMFMIGNMFVLLTTWWGSYLMEANGLSKEAAGLSLSIMSLGPLPLLVVVPWLSDNVFHSRRIFLLAAALLESAALAYVCFSSSALSFTELTVAGLSISAATTCMGPLSFTMVKESVPSSALASACGFLNCSGPVMAAVLQWLVGAVLTWQTNSGSTVQGAYSCAFLLLLAGSLTALAASLFMKDTLKR